MAGAGTAANTGAKVSMLGILLKWGGAGLLAGTVVAGGAAGVDRLLMSEHAVLRPNAERAPPLVTAANPSPDLPRADTPRGESAPVVLRAGGATRKR